VELGVEQEFEEVHDSRTLATNTPKILGIIFRAARIATNTITRPSDPTIRGSRTG